MAITFEASIPPLQSAINFHGEEGARVKIDIPESDIAAAAKLLLMRGKVLRITVEEVASIPAGPSVQRDPRARQD